MQPTLFGTQTEALADYEIEAFELAKKLGYPGGWNELPAGAQALLILCAGDIREGDMAFNAFKELFKEAIAEDSSDFYAALRSARIRMILEKV